MLATMAAADPSPALSDLIAITIHRRVDGVNLHQIDDDSTEIPNPNKGSDNLPRVEPHTPLKWTIDPMRRWPPAQASPVSGLVT